MGAQDDDGLAAFLSPNILGVKAIFVGVVFAIQLVVYSVRLVVAIVLRLEGLGVPWWLTIGSMALFPFACLMAVRRLVTGQEMNTLDITDRRTVQDNGHLMSFERRLMDPRDGSRLRPRLR